MKIPCITDRRLMKKISSIDNNDYEIFDVPGRDRRITVETDSVGDYIATTEVLGSPASAGEWIQCGRSHFGSAKMVVDFLMTQGVS